jgi:hypothetical protein
MKNYKLSIILILTILFSVSCSFYPEELGRLKINEVSTEDHLVLKESTIPLDKGEKISFWSEMDIQYKGEIGLRFRIEILKDSSPYGGLEIDPLNKKVTIGEVKSENNGQVNWRFTGKNASLSIQEDGIYTFKGIFISSENPSLIVNKAEVVIKK